MDNFNYHYDSFKNVIAEIKSHNKIDKIKLDEIKFDTKINEKTNFSIYEKITTEYNVRADKIYELKIKEEFTEFKSNIRANLLNNDIKFYDFCKKDVNTMLLSDKFEKKRYDFLKEIDSEFFENEKHSQTIINTMEKLPNCLNAIAEARLYLPSLTKEAKEIDYKNKLDTLTTEYQIQIVKKMSNFFSNTDLTFEDFNVLTDLLQQHPKIGIVMLQPFFLLILKNAYFKLIIPLHKEKVFKFLFQEIMFETKKQRMTDFCTRNVKKVYSKIYNLPLWFK